MILHPIISGGLRLHVIGASVQPSAPSGNTLWIETNTSIPWYYVGPSVPESHPDGTALADGDVWIETGTSSASVDVVSGTAGNVISVQMVAAKQYTNEAWESRQMMLYTAGKWTDAYSYLFKAGSGVAGGFSLTGDSELEGRVDVTDDRIIYSVLPESGGAFVFSPQISGKNTLCFDLMLTGRYDSNSKLLIGLSKNTDLNFTTETQNNDWVSYIEVPYTTERGVYQVPISEKTGYVKLNGLGTSGIVYNVWTQ